MNLPDFSQDEGFNRLRERMGAELIAWKSEGIWDPINIDEILVTTGVDTSLDDVGAADDGTLEYRGRRVVVYIRDQVMAYQPYKFHVADCDTLQNMRQSGRSERYVVATRTDGMFIVNTFEEDRVIERDAEHRLFVCRNCLKRLNYKNYDTARYIERTRICESFDLREFFEVYPSQIKREPTHTDTTAPLNHYTEDWPQVSLRHREQKDWRCERCCIDFGAPERRQLLHVHHINGIRHDNSAGNLRVLCIDCHSEEPLHRHMRNHSD